MDDWQKAEDRGAQIDHLVVSLASFFKQSGDCIVWIGSGLSIGCGYPSWTDAIQELCDVCIPGKADIKPSSLANELLEWADVCKATNRDGYLGTLARLFGGPVHFLRAAYLHISACPFRYLVTTNFDPCLEAACTGKHQILAYPNLALLVGRSRQKAIYLHGKARARAHADASTLLLTKTDLDAAYTHGASLLPSALTQLLISNRVVFVGCGLREPVLKKMFECIKQMQESSTSIPLTKKTILLPETQDEERALEEGEYMKSLGIDILRYPLSFETSAHSPRSPHHLLDEVWERVRIKVSPQSNPFSQEGGLPS
jgi:hypothetical protein